ncbi:MAG: prolyl oligopeptidase family serine peptidase, partial [Alphaproteobacteria bacterium]|nr:prolyl oligopeptidase family serine peptidase [Alphaproteobacteria bacterium]
GVSGHSMGGHGALTLALRHPDLFASVSAFAPICSPARCDWGRKAFTAYLGEHETAWAPHFQMETYVTGELPETVVAEFPIAREQIGVSGHSMGGHGALTLALRHPDTFRSVSAFAPICSPTRCPWGEKAFTAYLGEDRAAWADHDAARLIEAGAAKGRFDDILVDQGLADNFLSEQLKPELLEAACAAAGQKLTLRRQAGYDHSYFFMASFIADHVAFHAERLKG